MRSESWCASSLSLTGNVIRSMSSRTAVTPGVLCAISSVRMRSESLPTVPVKVARPCATCTSTTAAVNCCCSECESLSAICTSADFTVPAAAGLTSTKATATSSMRHAFTNELVENANRFIRNLLVRRLGAMSADEHQGARHRARPGSGSFRRKLLLAYGHFDLLRLRLCSLRHLELEHSMFVAGLDRVGIDRVRQRERRRERSVEALNAMELLAIVFLLQLALAGDCKRVALERNVDVLLRE